MLILMIDYLLGILILIWWEGLLIAIGREVLHHVRILHGLLLMHLYILHILLVN
jgi:hypothetical protein